MPIRYRSLLFFLIVVSVFVGCKNDSKPPTCEDYLKCVAIGPGEKIRLGVLQALSGGHTANGRSLVRSVQLAIDDRNRTLFGHPIHLQIEDSGCTAEMGRSAALKIAINLNTAGFADIAAFIGEKKARDFIKLRRERGYFESMEEITGLGFKFKLSNNL